MLADRFTTLISYIRQPKKRPLIREAFRLKDKTGIEIGGPTAFFNLKGGFPIYVFAKRVDNVNYDRESFFGNYEPGKTFKYYKRKIGNQFIAEATDLTEIPDNTYDFLLSSHSLEHTANPVKALKEWIRVIKPNGKIIILVPDKRYTVDHRRAYTAFPHLLDDYSNNATEKDTTHFEEILSTYDVQRSKVPMEEYEKLLHNNYVSRCAHHHVFSQAVIKTALEFVGFKVNAQYEFDSLHLITIATK